MSAPISHANEPPTRNIAIDAMRALGLLLVILAHVDPPEALFQMRNFDVPMLILASGMSFGLAPLDIPWRDYFWKRIRRLVFPVWVFLGAYFLVLHALGLPSAPNLHVMIGSFALASGIGFVWIIRVFLLIALAAPFVQRLDARLANHGQWLCAWLAFYLGYEALLTLTSPLLTVKGASSIMQLTHYLLPYTAIFWLGMRIERLPPKMIASIGIGALVSFASMAAYHFSVVGHFVPTQEFKYPPSAYYLSFAIALTIPTWLLARRISTVLRRSPRISAAIAFVGQNSIWIYLWHIPVVMALKDERSLPWPIAFATALATALALAHLQSHLVQSWLLPRVGRDTLRANLRSVLTG